MNNTVTSKLAALGVALLMNSFLLGGVAYVFNSEAQADTQAFTLAQSMDPSMDQSRTFTQTDAV
jgi:Mn2+/Fe2+ NRAMP family transporter